MPVSTCLAGSGEKVPSGLALNWMKTRFQISMQRGVAFVHERAAGVAGGREVDVDFGARAARAGVAHHPEIVLLVAVDDVDGGIESGAAEFLGPEVPGFLIELARVALAICPASKPWRRGGSAGNFQTLDDRVPRPTRWLPS